MINRIEVNPEVCHGKSVIHGTRIMVRNILGAMAGGAITKDLINNYSELTLVDIKAAIVYAIE